MRVESGKESNTAEHFSSQVAEVSSARASRQAAPRKSAPFVFLGFVWLLSFALLAFAPIDSLALRLFIMTLPMLLTLVVTWSRPADGYLAWSYVIVLLVLQTGFQLDLGTLRVSALEIVTVLLLMMLFWQRRRGVIDVELRLPGQRQLLLFIIFACVMLAVSLAGGTHVINAITPFKGFVLYPFIAYVLIAGLRTEQSLRRFVLLLGAGYAALSMLAIFQYRQGLAQGDALFRSTAEYAPSNIFGITAAVVALLLIGIAVQQKKLTVIYFVIGVLVVGAVTTLARSAGIVLIAGAIYMILIGRGRRRLLLLLPLLGILLIFLYLPEEALFGRLLQLTDSSTDLRQKYLLDGLQAWKASFLFGWGWGKSFIYSSFSRGNLPSIWQGFLAGGGRLISRNSIPWYHNDYLNLLVQVGIIGLALYLAFWLKVFEAGHRWLAGFEESKMRGYVLGSLSAIFGLLIAALFEHVLWRPDIAGLVGVFLGLLLVSMRISRSEETAEPS